MGPGEKFMQISLMGPEYLPGTCPPTIPPKLLSIGVFKRGVDIV
jgi:hypothetical protein